MKTKSYQKRFYRNWTAASDLFQSQIIVRETDLQILTDRRLDKDFVQEKVRLFRREIEDYIVKVPRFLSALKPIQIEFSAPAIVKAMASAARQANVGPMAAVAGTIAEFLGKALLRKGYHEVIIENGGDIFLASRRERLVRIYAGRSRVWKGLCLRIKPGNTPIGVCTSSGTVGHSLSFGCADSVVIVSKSACLADAVATATANRVQDKFSLTQALDFAKSIKGILGAVIIIQDRLASWGGIELSVV